MRRRFSQRLVSRLDAKMPRAFANHVTPEGILQPKNQQVSLEAQLAIPCIGAETSACGTRGHGTQRARGVVGEECDPHSDTPGPGDLSRGTKGGDLGCRRPSTPTKPTMPSLEGLLQQERGGGEEGATMKGTTKFRIICFFLILGPAWLAPFGSNADDANAVHLQEQGDPQQQQTRPEDEIFPLVEITWPRLGAEVSPVGFVVKGRVKNLLKSCKVVLLLDGHPVDDFAFDAKTEAHLDGPREMWFTTKLEKTPIGLHWFTASVQHDGAELCRTPRDVFFFVGRESAALEMRLREFRAADPGHARLRAWMDENVEGVKGMRAEPDPHGGLGLVADEGSISPGKIGFMPFSSCVGPESAVKSSAAAYLSPMFTNRKLPPELATAMLLLVQCSEDDPFFGPYIATLPLPGDVSGLFAWDGAFDHMMVENHTILGKSQHSQGYIDRAYGRFFDVVLREESTVGLFEHVPVGWFTRQNMLWALSLVWSRCWTQQVGSRKFFRLIPFIDLGNHAPQSQWHTREREGWHMDLLEVEQGYQLSIAEGVPGAGLRSVVTVTYGPYDNLQLFAQYGFVLCPNPFDVAIVVPPMSSGGGHCDEKHQDGTDDSHEAGTGDLECRGESHVGERLLEEQNVISAANLLNLRSHGQTASSESTEIWHELLLKTDGYETCVEKSKVSAGFAEELGMTLWEHALESDGEGGGVGGVKLSMEYLNGPGANLAKFRIDSDARVRNLWANLIDSLGCHASVER